MLPKEAYALDSDLDLVSKWPCPFIVARLDFKLEGDNVGFSEALCYQWFLDLPAPYTVPIYIIEAARIFKSDDTPVESHRFSVYRLVEADYRPFPPKVELELIAQHLDWAGLAEWEAKLRRTRQDEMRRLLAKARPQVKEQAIAYVISPS